MSLRLFVSFIVILYSVQRLKELLVSDVESFELRMLAAFFSIYSA